MQNSCKLYSLRNFFSSFPFLFPCYIHVHSDFGFTVNPISLQNLVSAASNLGLPYIVLHC